MASSKVVIDVRTPEEFDTGHVEGALNIEYQYIDQLLDGFSVNRDDDIVLYCRSGRRSGIAAERLKQLGFTRPRNIGSFEDAKKILKKEQCEEFARSLTPPKPSQNVQRLEKSLQDLLKGLKDVDG